MFVILFLFYFSEFRVGSSKRVSFGVCHVHNAWRCESLGPRDYKSSGEIYTNKITNTR